MELRGVQPVRKRPQAVGDAVDTLERGAREAVGFVPFQRAAAVQLFEMDGQQRELLSKVVEQPFTWDGMDLVEAGYGWRNISQLVDTAGTPAALH